MSLCLHCELAEATTQLGICSACYTKNLVRRVYFKTTRKPPARVARLDQLRDRANARLPLFEDEDRDPSCRRPARPPGRPAFVVRATCRLWPHARPEPWPTNHGRSVTSRSTAA